jgi:hypothetical protein
MVTVRNRDFFFCCVEVAKRSSEGSFTDIGAINQTCGYSMASIELQSSHAARAARDCYAHS